MRCYFLKNVGGSYPYQCLNENKFAIYLSKIETIQVFPVDTVIVISRLGLVLKVNIAPQYVTVLQW